MKETKTYADSVDLKEKKLIWRLYFFELYTYNDLLAYFKGKYTYAQLKSIIIERLKLEANRCGNSNKTSK